MTSKLFKYLKHEEQLISELLRLAERQQTALVRFDVGELQEITKYQIALSTNLRKAEEQRIDLLTNWLKISRKEAMNLTISNIEKEFDKNQRGLFGELKSKLSNNIEKLNHLNKENRILTNRALRSNAEMLNMITKGSNGVLNRKV